MNGVRTGIMVCGGPTVYLPGVTAASVYHRHPRRAEEFGSMPHNMAGQARAALTSLDRGLKSVGATLSDVVKVDRLVTDLADRDALNRVWGEFFGTAQPAAMMVQVV